MTKEEAAIIDRFVEFLIAETCEGCTQCEPRLPSSLSPDIVCCEQARVQWLLEMRRQFKENEDEKRD